MGNRGGRVRGDLLKLVCLSVCFVQSILSVVLIIKVRGRVPKRHDNDV